MAILFGIFLILHGLVHLLYGGQSLRVFELRPGFLWPDNSWFIAKLLGVSASRSLAAILLALTTLVFVGAVFGLFFHQGWWRPAALGAALLSISIFILYWDGRFQALDAQGGVALLINLAILGIVLIFKFPI